MKYFIMLFSLLNVIYGQMGFFENNKKINNKLKYLQSYSNDFPMKSFGLLNKNEKFIILENDTYGKMLKDSAYQLFKISDYALFYKKGFSSLYGISLHKSDDYKLYGNISILSQNAKRKKLSGNQEFTYKLHGSIKNLFYFHIENTEQFLNGDKSYSFNNTSYFKQSKVLSKVNSLDKSLGYFLLKYESNYLFLGKVPWDIGFGESGKFVLNAFQTPIPTSFGINLDFDWFRYHSIHSALTAPELMMDVVEEYGSIKNRYRKAPDKFMVSHRFEIDLWDNFTVHQNEMIVYGNRSLDMNYLNPFSFLRPLEHELGDRDNALITIGFKWKLPKYHIITYHDFLLDEWKISEVAKYFDAGETWFGNKHGIMNGISWANYNVQLWFEHVSIAPWVYTHKFHVNRYTHDSQPLGYAAGPNSQTFYYKAAYYPDPHWSFFISHRLVHKGKNYELNNNSTWNVGGDIFKGHVNENPAGNVPSVKETRRFLEGALDTRKQTIFNVYYQYNYYISTEIEYEYNWEDQSIFKFYFNIKI